MPKSTDAFVKELIDTILEKRTFGGHPLWHQIADGKVDREGMKVFAQQFFLQVREFPRAVSAMHANCPYAEARIELAENIYEEETGKISGCGMSHPNLFIQFGESLGLTREQMIDAKPLPGTAALIHWFEVASKNRSFLEAAAAINLAAEGQVPGAFANLARALQKHYGLSQDAVAFWDVHEEADKDHADVGDHIVVKHASTDELQARTRAVVEESLAMWWQFFDGIQRAIA